MPLKAIIPNPAPPSRAARIKNVFCPCEFEKHFHALAVKCRKGSRSLALAPLIPLSDRRQGMDARRAVVAGPGTAAMCGFSRRFLRRSGKKEGNGIAWRCAIRGSYPQPLLPRAGFHAFTHGAAPFPPKNRCGAAQSRVQNQKNKKMAFSAKK